MGRNNTISLIKDEHGQRAIVFGGRSVLESLKTALWGFLSTEFRRLGAAYSSLGEGTLARGPIRCESHIGTLCILLTLIRVIMRMPRSIINGR